MRKLWIIILIMIILSPLGIILPEIFKAGSAWGEWGPDELKELVGFIPQGMEKLSSLGKPIFPDYNLKIWENGDLFYQCIGYIISGFIGVGILILITYILGKILSKKEDNG